MRCDVKSAKCEMRNAKCKHGAFPLISFLLFTPSSSPTRFPSSPSCRCRKPGGRLILCKRETLSQSRACREFVLIPPISAAHYTADQAAAGKVTSSPPPPPPSSELTVCLSHISHLSSLIFKLVHLSLHSWYRSPQ